MATDWSTVIDAHLSRWHASTIRPADVDRAESWVRAAASSMLTVPGAWRAKVVNGSVYVKLLRVRPSWAERASVLRMLLMLANRELVEGTVHDNSIAHGASLHLIQIELCKHNGQAVREAAIFPGGYDGP